MLLKSSYREEERRSGCESVAQHRPGQFTRVDGGHTGNVTDPIGKTTNSSTGRDVYEEFDGQPVLVTGAGTGIGFAVAERFAEHGAVVGVNFLPGDEHGPDAVARLENQGHRALPVPADVTDEQELAAAVRQFAEVAGMPRVAISNAGIAQHLPFLDINAEDWDQMIRVHLGGARNVAATVLPSMLEASHGRLIFTASELAFVGAEKLTHYCAAKGGIISFAKALAREVGESGVTVNCVAPGPTETSMLTDYPEEYNDQNRLLLPLKRWGDPREIALTYLFLASDGGSWYTGQTLSPNGGAVM